jgi:multidrug efflux system membrane fusion protein
MDKNSYKKKQINPVGLIIFVLAVAGAVYMTWYFLRQSELNPHSEDAILAANLVNIAATVPGRINEINVVENQRVKKGDFLFSVDPKPLSLLVDQTKADLQIAMAAMDAQRRTLRAETQNALIADQQVARARTNLDLTEATLKRLEALSPKGYVTKQQVDDARTLRDDARISLSQANQQADAANALVGTLDSSEALVSARQAALALAEHNLENSKVYAPHDGLVVGLLNSSGQIIIPGQSVFTLIDTSAWYATATYPETELNNIRIGDCATVRIMANDKITVKGKVDSIGWGVSTEELINIPRNLPFIPKSLNWVHIAQRFPVRVKLIDPPAELTRSGASAVVTVHNGNAC